MRNVPFAFLNEETIDRINQAAEERRRINAFAHLAGTQRSLRGPLDWSALKQFLVEKLEQLTEMSGPNSIANLERALRQRR